MRRTLLAAIALTPLSLCPHGAVRAETTVNSTSNPVTTSAVGDDVVIGSGETVSPTSGAAVTLDSNNSLTNAGTISMAASADGSTAVLVNGGLAGAVTNSGTITVEDGYTASDSVNGDGIAEAPFASGAGRFGIHVAGSFNGSLTNSGTIAVSGDQSYGVAIDGALGGSLISSGTIALTGDNGAAVKTTGRVAGDVIVSGAVSALGAGSNALNLAGGVGGRVAIYSSVTSTGYATTTRPTVTATLNKVQATAADLLQGGAAVSIGGDVAGGILVGATASDTASTADVDGDGVADGSEGAGAILSYGAAPALKLGGSAPITIGAFGSGDNAYGLLIRGSVSGSGVYDGVSAAGIDIGAGVTVVGGARISGSVAAGAYQADATAFRLRSGAVLPELRNEGSITATTVSSAATTSTALQIDAGAQMSKLVNYGTLSAAVTGNAGAAVAVIDRSGTIAFVENTGVIKAAITPTTLGDATTGKAIALDLSANTGGVLLHQELNGDTAPSIVGDILLGSGVNTVQLLSGSIAGALDMGSGAGGLITVAGGASYLGAFRYGGSGLSLQILDGSFETTTATVIRGNDLTIGSAGTLTLAVDPKAGTSSQLILSGSARIAAGGALGVRLLSTVTGEQTFRLIQAGSLTVDSLASLAIATPYLFTATVAADTAAGALDVTVHRRTAGEMGLNRSEAAALEPVYAALGHDTGVQSLVLAADDHDSFVRSYDRLLPDHGGGVFQMVSQISQAGGRAALDNRLPKSGYWDSGVALWAQEFAIGVDQDKGDGEAFRAAGLGVAGGAEATDGVTALGLSITAATGDIDALARPGDSNVSVSLLEGGVYWRADARGWMADARLAAGYLSVKSRRTIAGSVDDVSISRAALADWRGYEVSGRVGLAYEANIGPFYVRPLVHADLLGLHEGGYDEDGGGDGYDLVVAARTGKSVSVTTALAVGANLGGDFLWRPEIQVGWKETVVGDAGSTTARFAYGGNSFTLAPNAIEGGALVAQAGIAGGNGFVKLDLRASGEFAADSSSASLRASAKIPF